MSHTRVPIIGLIGGVGSGKSSVARWLEARYRVVRIDADALGHRVLEREDVRRELVSAFGAGVESGGTIDRQTLAARVFGEQAESAAARRTLESIVHPVIRQACEEQIQAARRDEHVALILLDAPVLLESGWRDIADVLVFVDVPLAERMRRVATGRGWTAEELHRREASQWPLPRKRAAADVVIDNSSSLEAAGLQLEAYLRTAGWLAPEGAAPGDSLRSRPGTPATTASVSR
jgi:dephospho-CoA kinase